jgi:UDP-glucose 4-epimerase
MRALVTGGAGFIGSHVVDALLRQGADVAIVDHLTRSPREWFTRSLSDGAQLHVVDVRDFPNLRNVFESVRPDVVLHLAAQVDVRRSVADPAHDAEVNVAGTVSVLEAARLVGANRVIVASTAATYGNPADTPTREDAPIAPLSPYGASKAAAEWYLGQYARLYGISGLALRMANVFGPRQDPHGEAGVIAIFCGAFSAGKRATVYGDGRQTRDYIYVGDVVSAWVAAAQSEVTGALNVSTGTETSLLDLVELLALDHDFAPGRHGEIGRSCLDPSAAQTALNWRAETSLREGLGLTLEGV